MTVIVVLHLVSDALADGRLVGHAELARTGQRSAIRGIADLLALVNAEAARTATPHLRKATP